MISLRFKFSYLNVKYDFTIRSKYTIVQGDSATGKSTLVTAVTYIKNLPEHPDRDAVKNLVVVDLVDGKIDNRLFKNCDSEGMVFILDEDTIGRAFGGKLFEMLNRSRARFILIYREVYPRIHCSYKDIYIFSETDFVNKLFRRYADMDKWIRADSYTVEDSGSGFEYFKTRCSNTVSARGKENLINADVNSVIIADGAAIASIFDHLLAKGFRMYLPDSFEGLVLQHFKPEIVENALENCPTKLLNLEKYYEDIINKCGLPFKYSKSYLQREVYEAQLVPELSDIINPLPDNYFEEHELIEKRKEFMNGHDYYFRIVKEVTPIEKAKKYIEAINNELDLNRPIESLKEIYERM